MSFRSARFVTSLAGNQPFEGRGLPQIAVVGRSNVGKSSLINRLCGQQSLARTSAEPGKTRTINVFEIEGAFHLCDLPGYGFARVSQAVRRDWGRMMEEYLTGSELLLGIVFLVDIRHEPTQEDRQMAAWLRHYGKPFLAVATKADKLSRAAQSRALLPIVRGLVVQPWEVLPFSAATGQGADEVETAIRALLPAAPPPDGPEAPR